jgi:hypothetical protein
VAKKLICAKKDFKPRFARICELHFATNIIHSMECKLMNQNIDKISNKCRCKLPKDTRPSLHLPPHESNFLKLRVKRNERSIIKERKQIVEFLL